MTSQMKADFWENWRPGAGQRHRSAEDMGCPSMSAFARWREERQDLFFPVAEPCRAADPPGSGRRYPEGANLYDIDLWAEYCQLAWNRNRRLSADDDLLECRPVIQDRIESRENELGQATGEGGRPNMWNQAVAGAISGGAASTTGGPIGAIAGGIVGGILGGYRGYTAEEDWEEVANRYAADEDGDWTISLAVDAQLVDPKQRFFQFMSSLSPAQRRRFIDFLRTKIGE